MEKIAGAAIFIVGILLIAFGRARGGTADRPIAGPWRLPAWMDIAIQWGSGMLSLWPAVCIPAVRIPADR